jgi:hypothetical protein
MFFKKIDSIFDLKDTPLLVGDYVDAHIFPTIFRYKSLYDFELFTEEDIYSLIYSTDSRIFIIDSLIG